jgi:outer membrane protein TolC
MGQAREFVIGAVLALVTAVPAAGQAVRSLEEALAHADRHAYANRIAVAERNATAGEGLQAWRGILPSVRAEAGWMRTTDPLNAFGFTLRQRAVTPAAFDPARLNHPPATTGVGSALVVEQPLLNLDAWLGRGAAASATRAAGAMAEWTATTTRVQVIQAWFGGVLAAEKVATLEAAVEAAESHVRQAALMLEQGMVTRADLLLAQVKAGELRADLLAARGELSLAARQLATTIGAPDEATVHLPATLPARTRLDLALERAAEQGARPAERGDVVAARLGERAARRDLQRARAAFLPRINGFARYDWSTPDAVFGGKEAWTVGVMASWAPFSGGSELAASRAAQGRAEMASAGAEALEARAALEVAERENALAVARARLAIADEAVAQAEEAHRLVSRSYAGGLSTITELLGAAAAETGARLARSAALYRTIIAVAERQQALGLPLDILTALGR